MPTLLRVMWNPLLTGTSVLGLLVSFQANRKCMGKDPTATLPFSIQQQDKKTWLVKPNGEKFFSLGVCCVNQGALREEFDSANPGYAAWQHYPDSNVWAKATLQRLKNWGFTTVGGSDFQL